MQSHSQAQPGHGHGQAGSPDELEAMLALLRDAPLVDGHNDLLWELRQQVGYDFDRIDIADHCPTLHTDIPRLRRGGVGAQFWSVWVPSDLPALAALVGTLEQIEAMHRMIARYGDDLVLTRTAAEVRAAAASGRIASLAGVEGGHCIAESLGVLRILHQLGARYLTLTHNDTLNWADAAMDEPRNGGLTDFGREVVAELNRLGMLVDLSHVSPDTMRDALAATRAPVVFSHSNARALCNHPRNIPDDVLSALPGNGGVAMVTFVPGFVSEPIAQTWLVGDQLAKQWHLADPDNPDAVNRKVATWRSEHPVPPASVAMVADHVDHIREVAGVAHVGIGSDFDGTPEVPSGLGDVAGFPALFLELRARGYSDADLRAIAGRNVLRVMEQAEELAQ